MKVTPVRIQRKRTAGYDMQAASLAINGLPCISVSRPSRWGNPYDIRNFGLELSLAVFRNTIQGIWSPEPVNNEPAGVCALMHAAHNVFLKRLGAHPLEIIEAELGGKNLGCYCHLPEPGEPDLCHAAIEIELSNRGHPA
jgi:Domain of unknown function (DUF4326)